MEKDLLSVNIIDKNKKLEEQKSEFLNTFMNNANVLLNKANDNTKITAQAMQNVSMSALKYANEKFKDAPVLLPLENFNINSRDLNENKNKINNGLNNRELMPTKANFNLAFED